MSSELVKSYTEINEILKRLPQYYIKKIPNEILESFKDNADNTYSFYYDESKSLKEQSLKDETKAILAVLKYNYWCNSKEEKNEISNRIIENEKKYQEELEIKYNKNIFENDKSKEIEDNSIGNSKEIIKIEKKENIFEKIKKFLKNIFKIQ